MSDAYDQEQTSSQFKAPVKQAFQPTDRAQTHRPSVVVLFPLMTTSGDRHSTIAIDHKKGHVTGTPKRNEEFPPTRVALQKCFAAREG